MPQLFEEAEKTTRELTSPQKLFCTYYYASENGAESYRRAFGYDASRNPRRQAYKLLQKPHIKEALEELKAGNHAPVYDKSVFDPLAFDVREADKVVLAETYALSRDPTLSAKQRADCLAGYRQLRKTISADYGDTDRDSLPASIDQAIADIKAGVM